MIDGTPFQLSPKHSYFRAMFWMTFLVIISPPLPIFHTVAEVLPPVSSFPPLLLAEVLCQLG